MADSIYDRGRALAIRQLSLVSAGGKGAAMTLIHNAPSTYVPGGVIAPTAETRSAGSGVRTMYASRDVDGIQVQRDDVKLILSPQLLDGSPTPTPKVNDVVLFEGVNYRIQRVSAWNYAGIDCGWVLQGRQ